jgi:leucyl aminopeptidase
MSQPVQPLFLSIQPAEGDVQAELEVVFEFAPEEPKLGAAGKSAGDVLLRESADGSRTALVSLGPQKNVTPETYRQAGGGLARWLKNAGVSSARIDAADMLSTGPDGSLNALLEGLYLGAFEFTGTKVTITKLLKSSCGSLVLMNLHSASSAPKRSHAP